MSKKWAVGDRVVVEHASLVSTYNGDVEGEIVTLPCDGRACDLYVIVDRDDRFWLATEKGLKKAQDA